MFKIKFKQVKYHLLSGGGLANGGFSLRLMLGGSAGECSDGLGSGPILIGPGEGSLLIIDKVSLVFRPGFRSRWTTGGGGGPIDAPVVETVDATR